MKFYDDDDIWDEFQWEAHLSELEEQNEQIRGFLESTLNEKNEPRWMRLMEECSSELDLMNTYIEEELLIEDSYFPDDEDWEEDDDEFDDPMFDSFEGEWEDVPDDEFIQDDENDLSFLGDDLDDELDEWDLEGEEWKALSEEFAFSDYGSIENLAVYVTARDFGVEIFRLLDHKKELLQAGYLQDFVSTVVQISAKLAGGYAFGFEDDVLGANIAYSKRALHYANAALEKLQALKSQKVFNLNDYNQLHATLFELRNDIGVYVQDLREQFY